jgi:hypothetical protein
LDITITIESPTTATAADALTTIADEIAAGCLAGRVTELAPQSRGRSTWSYVVRRGEPTVIPAARETPG